jgi:hypothetical protein
MITIAEQESAPSSSPMWIDSASVAEVCSTVFGFAFLLFFVHFGGLTGHEARSTELIERAFVNGSAPQRFAFDFSPITAYHCFLEIEMSMIRFSATGALPPVTFGYAVAYEGAASARPPLNISGYRFVPRAPGPRPAFTEKMRLLRDSFLDYGAAGVVVTVSAPPEYKGLALFVSQGVSDQTSFEAYVRVVYALFGIAAAYLWLNRLAGRAFRNWAFEQKFTFVLVLVGVVANNPLYAVHVYSPIAILPLIEVIAPPLFHGMAYALVLLNLDLVLNANAKRARSLIGGETLVGIGVFVSEMILSGYQTFWLALAPRPFRVGLELLTERVRVLISLVFVVWASFRAVNVVRWVDLTERFRSYMCAISSSVVVGHALIVHVLAKMFGWFAGSGVEFVSAFAVYNTFDLMMLYFHWPYEPVADMTYEAGGAKASRKACSESVNAIGEELGE